MIVDPLAGLEIEAQSYDIKRTASVYFNWSGDKCFGKAWFNGNTKGEPAVEIPVSLGGKFIRGEISKDNFLSRFYPAKMQQYQQALANTRKEFLGL